MGTQHSLHSLLRSLPPSYAATRLPSYVAASLIIYTNPHIEGLKFARFQIINLLLLSGDRKILAAKGLKTSIF